MVDPSLSVGRFMTEAPVDVDAHATLAEARRRMQRHKIHHLPVSAEGRLVGILSERDLYMLTLFPEVDPAKATVNLAMTPAPYSVAATAAVARVAAAMERRRIGSALVVDSEGRLVGIFTETDALRALSTLLSERTRHHSLTRRPSPCRNRTKAPTHKSSPP